MIRKVISGMGLAFRIAVYAMLALVAYGIFHAVAVLSTRDPVVASPEPNKAVPPPKPPEFVLPADSHHVEPIAKHIRDNQINEARRAAFRDGKPVLITGRMHRVGDHGGTLFLADVRGGSDLLACSMTPAGRDGLAKLSRNDIVTIRGTVGGWVHPIYPLLGHVDNASLVKDQ